MNELEEKQRQLEESRRMTDICKQMKIDEENRLEQIRKEEESIALKA